MTWTPGNAYGDNIRVTAIGQDITPKEKVKCIMYLWNCDNDYIRALVEELSNKLFMVHIEGIGYKVQGGDKYETVEFFITRNRNEETLILVIDYNHLNDFNENMYKYFMERVNNFFDPLVPSNNKREVITNGK